MKILLIEDDRNLSDSICEVLKRRRMDGDAVYDGEDGLAYAPVSYTHLPGKIYYNGRRKGVLRQNADR